MRNTITLLAAVAVLSGGGVLTATGQLSPEDRAAAEKIERLAKEGNAEAQFALAFCYQQGKFGKLENYQKAFEWYMKSANHGYPDAFAAVAVFYFSGKEVEVSLIESRAWYLLAKSQHSNLAKSVSENMETVFDDNMTTEDITKSQVRAEELQKQIAAHQKKKKAESEKKVESKSEKAE